MLMEEKNGGRRHRNKKLARAGNRVQQKNNVQEKILISIAKKGSKRRPSGRLHRKPCAAREDFPENINPWHRIKKRAG